MNDASLDLAGALPPVTPTEGPPAAPGVPPLARLEVLDRDGRVRQAVNVAAWPLTIGRAIDNDVVLDDPHVAAYHARIDAGAGGGGDDGGGGQGGSSAALELRVLPGRNGMRWGRRLLPPGGDAVPLEPPPQAGTDNGSRGAIELIAGQTRLRLRRAGDSLDPERELAAAASGHVATLVLALLLWLWILAEQAIVLDPGSKASDWLPPLVGAPLALAGWCLLWGLASKLFQHRFEFWRHLAVVVRGLLAIEVTHFALLWASALTGSPGFSRLALGATAAIGVLTLWAQARLVLPHQRRPLAWAAAAAYVAGSAILLALNQQRNERWFEELYAYTLPPPSLLWQTAQPRDAFVRLAEQLRPALQTSVAEAAEELKQKGDASED